MPEQPSRFYATPAQIDAFLRQNFAEDALLHFYQAVGDEVLDEIETTGKEYRAKSEAEQGKHIYLAGMSDVLDWVHDNRYYPKALPAMDHHRYPVKTPPKIPEHAPCPATNDHPPHRYAHPVYGIIPCLGYFTPEDAA